MINSNFSVIESETNNSTTISILAYDALKGSENFNVAEKIFFFNQANIKLKQVKIDLSGREDIIIEPGSLYFMRGDLELKSSTEGLAKGLFRKAFSGETLFQSRIQGQGEVYLEPSFGHYLVFKLDNDSVMVDKGSFYCCTGNMSVTARLQSNVSSALFGGEGLFQTEVSGTGIVVLKSPVPLDELMSFELKANEKLSIDGNFSIARTSSVKFKAEKSAKSIFQTVVSGEMLLQTFTGPGTVWLAPTQPVYDEIEKKSAIASLVNTSDSSGIHINK